MQRHIITTTSISALALPSGCSWHSQELKLHRNSFSATLPPSPASPGTHVPPQNSIEVMEPPGPEGSARSSSTGMPMETTRTGSG